MKLLRIGLPHSLHLTRPISEVAVSGREPKIFMSGAESHEDGGEGSDAGSSTAWMSNVNGEGAMDDALSLMAMMVDGQPVITWTARCLPGHQSIYRTNDHLGENNNGLSRHIRVFSGLPTLVPICLQ